nr:hypothetical protein OHB51_17360 [Micromonospora sp. NBC_00855]
MNESSEATAGFGGADGLPGKAGKERIEWGFAGMKMHPAVHIAGLHQVGGDRIAPTG